MLIVTVARNDLRDEITMADEAFALSPSSARATLPSEADYDAIREAFMETSRGRWFLGEYAKRNRNADTTMVLDAVVRIEQTLAAQKQPASEDKLAEALSAIRGCIEEAKAVSSLAVDGLALEGSLAPMRKGARVIREISWRLREIGADGRICDLIDSQIAAIETGCEHLSAHDPAQTLRAAFNLIEQKIDECDGCPPSPATSKPASTELDAAKPAAPAVHDEIFTPTPEAERDDSPETFFVVSEQIVRTEAGRIDAEQSETLDDQAAAQDEAMLDLIALEMGAPDFSEPEAADTTDEDIFDGRSETGIAAYEAVAPEAAETQTAPSEPIESRTIEPEVIAEVGDIAIVPEPEPVAAPQPSLGAALIANGIVSRPALSNSDPLAPIRRMSQAERMAFFS
jgi:hypothetical protein